METEPGDEELEAVASELVHAVLDRALSEESNKQTTGYKQRNIAWVSCRDFTIEKGQAQIEQYLRTWEMSPGWMFSVCFIQQRELEFHRQFFYRALWSVPTRRAPIPRGTVSVYFTIEIKKTKPQNLPVTVRFLVESNRTEHTPGQTRVREKWLRDVIDSKSLLLDTVDF